MYLPTLSDQSQTRIVTETFRGYDHNMRILPGSWYDEMNLSAEHYPLFAQREKRGYVKQLTQPLGMLAKDALMYIDGSTVYYNELPIDGIALSTEAEMLPKQMISMGAYAVIFPDKVYINTTDLRDVGSLDASYAATGTVSLQMCRLDGTPYDTAGATVAPEAPDKPENGELWIDSSGDTHVLRQYSAASATWVDVATVYVRIGAANIGANFAEGDGVTIAGLSYSGDETAAAQLDALTGDHIIAALADDYIVIAGILDRAVELDVGLTVKRECPDMDYVTESNNRLWGCKYGYVDGETVNEIYACKLGDPKNWRAYAGLTTDSYAASVGSDGKFTGAITHLGYPLFFKEGCIHKVYGSAPSSFGIQTTLCRGVQDGAWRSLNIVNETLYYQSRTDICAYDGSLPTGVSEALGTERYSDGAAGSVGAVYYISMRDATGQWAMFTLDTTRSIWHREDMTHALCFATARGELMYMDADSGMLVSARGMSGEKEDNVEWSAESGLMGYEYPYGKYLGRYSIRARLGADAEMAMYLEYDGEGGWIKMGECLGDAFTRTVTIPVIPRRCDNLRLKISGRGDVKIYSISRMLEGGSDVWL